MLTTTATLKAARTTTTVSTTGNRNSGSSDDSAAKRNVVDTDIATTTLKTTRIKTATTITSDPGILCFHHCNVKVFCFTLPHTCPQCKTALAAHANGEADSAGGTGGSGSRLKNKTAHSMNKNNKNSKNNNRSDSSCSSSSNNSNNAVQSLPIDSNKDDNDVGENGIDNNTTDNSEEDEDNKNDFSQNSFSSTIMVSRLLPFRLPYPFVRANQYPCAIVLRPTTGDFLNDYNNTTDLHIAVTTSTGCVVEFDRHGLRRHRTDKMSEWWQCLLVGDVPEPWYDYWDQVLFEMCQQTDKWTVSHYHEDKHNCYTFVLTFLQALTYDKLSEAATSKTRFCEKYIVPRTTTAGKYISLYRKLRDAGIYVHHTNHHKVRYAKQEKEQQNNLNKSSNLIAKTTSMNKNILVANKQQQQHQQQLQQYQQPSSHHNHHSIMSRPHSTLCTIEE